MVSEMELQYFKNETKKTAKTKNGAFCFKNETKYPVFDVFEEKICEIM